MSAWVEVRDLEYQTGGFRLGPISFSLDRGRTLSIVGPNGAGKTTLLRLIAGLEAGNAGVVNLLGEDSTRRTPEHRGIGFVFQDLALFPHLSVAENIGYGLWVRGVPRGQRQERVASLAADFGISPFLERRPAQLSGGERQRVAIARALATEPSVLLLDEPLSSVDPENRRGFLTDLKQLLRSRSATVVHVSHDLDEGAFLSDEMAVMMDGRVVQHGPTQAVLDRPASEDVARFLGYNVVLDADTPWAVLPSDFTLGPSGPGPRLVGTVRERGLSQQGILLQVRLEPTGDEIRVEFDRGRSEPSSLGIGAPVALGIRRRVRLGQDPPSGP